MKTPKFNIGDKVSYEVTNIKTNEVRKEENVITSIKYLKSIDDFVYNGFMEDELTFIEEKQELPKTWKDVKNYVSNRPSDNLLSRWAEICHLIETTNDYATKEFWKHISFMKLILLRDIYRQGWKPDWDNCDITFLVYAICYGGYNSPYKDELKRHAILSFQSAEIRDLFLKNFKDLIEECKEFI